MRTAQLHLFDVPALPATRPRAASLAERALRVLLEGGSLDHPTFQAATGSWRLASIVFELRAMGWPIETIDQVQLSNGRPSRTIAVYGLPAGYLTTLRDPQAGVAA